MSLSSRCGISLAEPRYLARHLRIDLPAHTELESAAVRLGESRGWRQLLQVGGAGGVRVETVTFALGRCALDWVLTARGEAGHGAARPDFEAWWQGWRPPGPPAPAAPAGTGP